MIAQREYVEMLHYQNRLRGFFARRNAAQFQGQVPLDGAADAAPTRRVENFGAQIDATRLFDEEYRFELGGIRFELYHTPGETYEHMTVWMPELRAAFVGDNYYDSFPNLYTLRGTKPRWALDYVAVDRPRARARPRDPAAQPRRADGGRGRGEEDAHALSRRHPLRPRRHRARHERGQGRLHLDARDRACRPSSKWARATARSPGACAASTKATPAGSTATRPPCTRRRRRRSTPRS